MKLQNTEIIVHILEGTATVEEYRLFKEWLHDNGDNLAEFKHIEALWNAIDILKNTDGYDYQKAYNSFKAKTEEIIQPNPSKRHLLSSHMVRYTGYVAAIFIGVIILLAIGYHLAGSSQNAQANYLEMIVPIGGKSQLILPDGTKIWLNAGSKLRYPSDFKSKEREVYLEGEGFFEVARDVKHPFLVRTSDITIKVLGTVFNVKSYPSEKTIQTTLISGSVIIEGKIGGNKIGPLATLEPNQMAIFLRKDRKMTIGGNQGKSHVSEPENSYSPGKKQGDILVVDDINVETYTSWKNNSLIFENQPFENIAVELERRYGATIVFIDDSIKHYRFSGRFDEISIDQALNALKFASPFRYEIKNRTIYIGAKIQY
jgi:transmembrane sensor